MRVEGTDHCGTITLEADIGPDKFRICYYIDCQQLSDYCLWRHAFYD